MTPGQVKWLAAGLDAVPEDDEWVDSGLAERLDRMPYTKRYSESRLARWAAKKAIALSLGVEPTGAALRSIVVINAADGAPEVRNTSLPFHIALTDRADWAVCMVATPPLRIGCDLEVVEPRSAAFLRDYFTAREQADVAASGDPHVAANLIWSAKESALKVMRTGLRRDTRSIEVSLQKVTVDGWQPLQIAEQSGRGFAGWWIRCGAFLLTCAADAPIDPPISLRDSAPLASARPSHGWMANPTRPALRRRDGA
jgi:4'-phosphopantetheinyl transferase